MKLLNKLALFSMLLLSANIANASCTKDDIKTSLQKIYATSKVVGLSNSDLLEIMQEQAKKYSVDIEANPSVWINSKTGLANPKYCEVLDSSLKAVEDKSKNTVLNKLKSFF